MIKLLLKKYEELLRYGFWGVMTVLVNTVLYLGFSALMGDLAANTLAFFLAVQFAYMSNTKFVFRDKFTKKNFLQFWGMRIGTIFIDNGGMWLLLAMDCNRLLAKCVVNAIVIVLNYIFSKFFIYKKRD
ncbi:MAG: GtrA family protein [Oscillibacter sp.]|nr:GtrA family protein [Oscillibacter sp.]MEA4993369.1 GtrA family protein [Oscillibacter sp.]